MKKSFIKQMKQKLIAQKTEILEKCKRHNAEIDVFGDEIDRIQASVIALADARLANRDKDNLAKIEATLKRIDENTFGECQECNEDIDEKRLMINPAFITCISCAEHLEMLKRKHGG
jgi:DnaK suppressor protein